MSILIGGICSLCCHMVLVLLLVLVLVLLVLVLAFMHLYSIFNLRLFLCILFNNVFNQVMKCRTSTASPNFSCHFFYESNTEGTNFRIKVYVLRL